MVFSCPYLTYAGKGVTASALTGSTVIPQDLQHWLTNAPAVGLGPKSYLNWVLFDEQFRPVGSNSVFVKVGAAETISPITGVANITKSGYLYVYCSNESNVDVFFDNIQLVHTRGPLLEETHYYPFGLTMAGISSKAAGKIENRYKYNNIELDEDLGLNSYEAFYRNLDQQTGRWWQLDPQIDNKLQEFSPYSSMRNNPILRSDPLGDFDDYWVNKDGSIDKTVTNDKFDRIYLTEQITNTNKKEGVTETRVGTFVGQFDKNENGLIQLPSEVKGNGWGGNFGFSVKSGNESKAFIKGDALAALVGAVAETHTTDLTVNQFSLSNGSSPDPSVSHVNGKNGDLRYLRKDESGAGVVLGDSKVDVGRQSSLTNSLNKFGWKDMISEKFKSGNSYMLFPHTSSANEIGIKSNHSNHLHLQGFKPKINVSYVMY